MMENKRERILRCLVLALLEVTVFVLLFNSLLPVPISDAQSNAVTKAVEPILSPAVPGKAAQILVVRKLAHVEEYMLLGAELGALAMLNKKRLPVRAAASLPAGLLIGFLDETVQIFSGRGPKISDVWLDTLGVFLGLAAALAVYGLVRLAVRLRRKKRAV